MGTAGERLKERPHRRHVRLGCILQVGGRDVTGHTVDVGTSGFRAHFGSAQVRGVELPSAGTELSVRLLLPEPGPLVCGVCSVVWVQRGEGASGDGSVELGAQLVELDPVGQRRLARFLEDFRYRVVVIEPDEKQLSLARDTLAGEHEVVGFTQPDDALAFVAEREVSAVVVSEWPVGVSARELLERLSAALPHRAIARIVATLRDPAAVLAELSDASSLSYVVRRPFRPSELKQAVTRGVEAFALSRENERLTLELERVNHRLQRENRYLRRRLEPLERVDGIVGSSPKLRAALSALEKIRVTDSPVHVRGETGTGKELVARALHYGGPRAEGPFVAQNCAGLSEELLRSTIFGHRRGAFTGAERDHPGVFEQANGGTLFLDEVGELSPSVQASLLRVLQDGELTPLGATRPIRVEVRVVSATHRDLRLEVREGRFREDLFFRLVVVTVELPPLREREGDLPLLANHFLQLHCQRYGKSVPGFSPELMRALERHRWPGNVRELENEIERLVAFAEEGRPIELGLLRPELRASSGEEDAVHLPRGLGFDASIELLERALVERAMAKGGSVTEAGKLLGLERSRLGKLRRRLGLAGGGEPEEAG